MKIRTVAVVLGGLSLMACQDDATPETETQESAEQAAAEPAAEPAAAEGAQPAEAETEEAAVAEVPVDEAETLFVSGKAVPVDANSAGIRAEHGVIPGAVLLTSSSQYDAGKELPKDKSTQLVFYCGNTQCSASDTAAARAQEAGYANVKILRAGIMGWKEAGKQTQKPAAEKTEKT